MSASQQSPPEHLTPENEGTSVTGQNQSSADDNVNVTHDESANTQQQQRLALPAVEANNQNTRLEVSGSGDIKQTISFDDIGPLVINKDGTLSRIHNWAQMTEPERERTVRVLGKRNMLRKEAILKEEEVENLS